MENKHYKNLIIMAGLSFACMYVLMYAMVNTWKDVFSNFNQFYMAGLMAAPMVLIELGVMRHMYKNVRKNILIGALSLVTGICFFLFIRQQTGVSDVQFLKSMIPHHSSAILMCTEANIHDPEIKELCNSIAKDQQKEIDQMNAILHRIKAAPERR